MVIIMATEEEEEIFDYCQHPPPPLHGPRTLPKFHPCRTHPTTTIITIMRQEVHRMSLKSVAAAIATATAAITTAIIITIATRRLLQRIHHHHHHHHHHYYWRDLIFNQSLPHAIHYSIMKKIHCCLIVLRHFVIPRGRFQSLPLLLPTTATTLTTTTTIAIARMAGQATATAITATPMSTPCPRCTTLSPLARAGRRCMGHV